MYLQNFIQITKQQGMFYFFDGYHWAFFNFSYVHWSLSLAIQRRENMRIIKIDLIQEHLKRNTAFTKFANHSM